MSSEEDTPSRQTVADPEEFNQQRRLRSIHDARDRARATYEATQDPSVDADYQTLAANYRSTIQNYIGEIEGLLQTYDFDDSDIEKNYWEGVDLGPLTISPPPKLVKLRDQKDVSIIGDSDLGPVQYEVPGLSGYLEIAAHCPIRESFSIHIRRRHKGQETVTGASSTEMPISVSYEAFRTANRFLTDVGFDVEIETQEHRSDVTDEVLEEVERWRKQNL